MSGLVIIGSGLAGYTLAREYRKRDRNGEITIVTADGGEMYAKPMLSNAHQQGKTLAALANKSAAEAGTELNATVLTRTRVSSLDRDRHEVVLASGRRIHYTRLVLAIGADPRPYSVPGSDIRPIHAVNDLDSYRAWREGLGKRVLLIGAGLIGAEFANDLRIGGHDVTMIDPAPWPLGRLLPGEIGQETALRLEMAGITVKCGHSLQRVETAADGSGIATLDGDGERIAYDSALSAIGLVPRTALAQDAGLAVGRGIKVDNYLTTSDPDIFALGDCAETEIGLQPFVLPLMAEAKALGATLAGERTRLTLPAMPVVVKTPAFPLVVCPPPAGSNGEWKIEGAAPDLKALFADENGQTLGFVLTGALIVERQALAKTMPATLP